MAPGPCWRHFSGTWDGILGTFGALCAVDFRGGWAGFHAPFYRRDVLSGRSFDPGAVHREHDLNAVAVLAGAPQDVLAKHQVPPHAGVAGRCRGSRRKRNGPLPGIEPMSSRDNGAGDVPDGETPDETSDIAQR